MRRIRILQHISLDGVIQAPGGPGEDPEGEFRHGGWIVPFTDPVVAEAVQNAHRAEFALLLGRYTYDIWSQHWPHVSDHPLAHRLNVATKHVVTHRPESLAWGPVQSVGPDIAAGVRRLKSSRGPDLIVWGSATLTTLLIEHELADEMMLMVYPVLLGSGKRLFSERAAPCGFTLLASSPAPSGVQINHYRHAGSLKTGTYADCVRGASTANLPEPTESPPAVRSPA